MHIYLDVFCISQCGAWSIDAIQTFAKMTDGKPMIMIVSLFTLGKSLVNLNMTCLHLFNLGKVRVAICA